MEDSSDPSTALDLGKEQQTVATDIWGSDHCSPPLPPRGCFEYSRLVVVIVVCKILSKDVCVLICCHYGECTFGGSSWAPVAVRQEVAC